MCPIIILMYHGYIRNKKSLCRQLGVEDAGIREEVEKNLLIEGYKKWGKEVVNHIYGSFAFAIHDDVRNETVCARDPFGICSFYYWIGSSGELVYSIDVREIIDNEGYSKEMNLKAFQYYTMLGYMAGEETLYKNIYKLMPGQILICKNNKGMDALYMMLGVDSTVWLEGDILFGAGISSRKNGVNLVLPFLDRRFFELSSRIPAELKLKDNCGKYIFRKTASKYLNTNIAYRKKVGFKNPVRQCYRRIGLIILMARIPILE